MPFFEYTQNNSGGSMIYGDYGASTVFIEASSSEEANSLAQDYGIYFDGCEDGMDCPCCGDRWSRAYSGEEKPKYYLGYFSEEFRQHGKGTERSLTIVFWDGTVLRKTIGDIREVISKEKLDKPDFGEYYFLLFERDGSYSIERHRSE